MNKTNYVERRKAKQRGQGDPIRGKFYPKGSKVPYTNREGLEKEYPNAAGEHLVRLPGKGLQYMSRKEVRQRAVLRMATAKNYQYQKDKNGFTHMVSEPGTGRDSKHVTIDFRLPGISNHTAHRERQIAREALKQQTQRRNTSSS